VQFAKYDTSRSIPSVVDGFKPSQRKVAFSAFKKKLKNDIKVAQFVGYISEHSAYHHGEASLENTIINLAQNFVGSNNVNFLVPSGQFGTRLQGGKDHAASRYIYTRMAPVMRLVFPPDDDKVLNYLEDEGQSIEPKWYCPILPTVLVNGADGIGTGWSSSVPNHNPRDIIRNIRRMLRGEKMEEMAPWFKGYQGTITASEKDEGKFDVVGCIQKRNETTLVITELPVRTWTQSYKEFLEELMPQEVKKQGEGAPDSTISDFREYHTENTVHFEITMTAEQMARAEKEGLEKVFKLKTSIATTNMVLFDKDGKIAKYNTALDILKDFCALRKTVYKDRKAYLVARLTREKEILSNKARFILMVVKGELELRKRKKADLLEDLQKRGFKKMSELDALLEGRSVDEEENKASEDKDADKSDYDYLLGMNLWSLTLEKVEELKKLRDQKTEELNELKKTTIETMWDRDLEALLKGLDEIEALEAQEAEEAAAFAGERRKRRKATAPPPAPKRKPGPKSGGGDQSPNTDKALLKRPLQEGASTEEVEKTTWGSGAPLVRSAPVPLAPARGEEPPPQPPAKAPRQARTRSRANLEGDDEAGKAEAAAAPEPPKQEDGAQLLSRLLSRSGTSDLSISSPTPSALGSSSFSNHTAFGGTADVFSYMKLEAPSSLPEPPGASGGLPLGTLTSSSLLSSGDGESAADAQTTPAKAKRQKKG